MSYTINRPRPPTTWDFLQFPMFVFCYTWVGVTGVVYAVHFEQPLAWPFALAGIAAAIHTTKQAARFDVSIWYVMNPQINIHQDKPEPVLQTAYANVKETPAGRETRYGDYHLEDSERARLATWILRQGGVSRDGLVMLAVRGLPDMKKPTAFSKTGYDELLTRWGRGGLGWLEGNRLTEEGRAHFTQFVQRKQTPPEHSPTPPAQYQVARVHEATSGATTKRHQKRGE